MILISSRPGDTVQATTRCKNPQNALFGFKVKIGSWSSAVFLELIVFLIGNPDTGKTILAASSVHELKSSSNKPNVCYFFFDLEAVGKSLSEHAYRSILAQLLQQIQSSATTLDLFTFAMCVQREGQRTATDNELLELLSTVISRLDASYIVLDAVDECSSSNEAMAQLFKSLEGTTAKILLFSRPNVAFLRRKVKGTQCLPVTRACVQDDLRLYFTHQLDMLQDSDLLPDDIDKADLVKYLLIGADGMFQWAHLMMAYLGPNAMVPSGRLLTIRKLKTPERLDEMYLWILTLLSCQESLLGGASSRLEYIHVAYISEGPIELLLIERHSHTSKSGWYEVVDQNIRTNTR